MRRISYAVALVALFLLLLNAGCYTVLRHPTGSNVVQEDTYYRSCADCHADASYYHPYSQPYYSSHYRWGSYYGSPWWYDDYYYWGWDPGYDYDDDYIGPKVETGSRHLWSTGGWGFGTSGSRTRSPSPSVTSPGQKNEKNAKKKEAEKKAEKREEKKKEQKEDERNLWKKPTRSRG